MTYQPNDAVYNKVRKLETLSFRLKIGANATPANKTHYSELGEVLELRTEGKAAAADAIEDLSADFTTAVDATNAIFGMILRKELSTDSLDGIGEVERVVEARIADIAGNSSAMSVTLLSGTDAARGLTTEKNIALEVTTTGLDLATETAEIEIVLTYLRK